MENDLAVKFYYSVEKKTLYSYSPANVVQLLSFIEFK